jgi:hypothetical protein
MVKASIGYAKQHHHLLICDHGESIDWCAKAVWWFLGILVPYPLGGKGRSGFCQFDKHRNQLKTHLSMFLVVFD